MSIKKNAAASVDDIIAIPAARKHPVDKKMEQEVFLELSSTLSRQPELANQRLIEAALKLTSADSASLTLESDDMSEQY